MKEHEAMLLGAEQALRTEGGTPTAVQLVIDVLRELVAPKPVVGDVDETLRRFTIAAQTAANHPIQSR